jgi:hypothetical protein
MAFRTLAARDMASSGWLRRFAGLKDKYLHHIREEEQERFVCAEKHPAATDIRHIRRVFDRRKKEEKAAAKVEKKKPFGHPGDLHSEDMKEAGKPPGLQHLKCCGVNRL